MTNRIGEMAGAVVNWAKAKEQVALQVAADLVALVTQPGRLMEEVFQEANSPKGLAKEVAAAAQRDAIGQSEGKRGLR